MSNVFISLEFIKFLLCGGIAAIVNFLSRIVLSYLGMEYVLAVTIAYVLGMVIAFALFRFVIFIKTSISMLQAMVRFVLVNLLGIFITVLVSYLLFYHLFPIIDFTFYPEEIAHGFAISLTAFTSYIGHKYFSFKSKF